MGENQRISTHLYRFCVGKVTDMASFLRKQESMASQSQKGVESAV